MKLQNKSNKNFKKKRNTRINTSTESYLSCAPGKSSAGNRGSTSAMKAFLISDNLMITTAGVQQLNTHLLQAEHVPSTQCDNPRH